MRLFYEQRGIKCGLVALIRDGMMILEQYPWRTISKSIFFSNLWSISIGSFIMKHSHSVKTNWHVQIIRDLYEIYMNLLPHMSNYILCHLLSNAYIVIGSAFHFLRRKADQYGLVARDTDPILQARPQVEKQECHPSVSTCYRKSLNFNTSICVK